MNPEGDLKEWQDKMSKMFDGKTAAATVPAPGAMAMPSGPLMVGAAESPVARPAIQRHSGEDGRD